VTRADLGRTVVVARGATVHLVLDSTYWTIGSSSDASVLSPIDRPHHETQPGGCPPGVGCGTVEQNFRAVGAGTARLTAHRRLCGESLLCAPERRTFTATVAVRR
jgi:hypothetical protein